MQTLRKFLRTDIGWIVLVGVVLVLLQIAATLITAREIERTSARIVGELARLQTTTLSDEKTRQEVLNLRIQNEIRGLLSNSLLVGIGPMVTAFVALVGALLGLRNYLQSREKERLDRASGELKDTMDRLVKDETWQRAAGVLGLQHFLSPDLREYHVRAVSALAMAARMEGHAEVVDTVRIAVEQAVRSVDEAVLQQVSWQRARLNKARFGGPRALRRLDLRDALLHDADLARCDLSGGQFANAQLNGARLDGALLVGADLSHADLAGARLAGADLRGALLYDAKVMGMDVEGAQLAQARLDADTLPWEMVVNWRRAALDPALRARLIERYGDEPSGPHVLMLMWEIAPLVAGGTWTACFHLVRNLRRRGAHVTVVVPWSESLIVAHPFGSEVRVVALGIVPPELEPGGMLPYGPYGAGSPYGGAPSWSSYAAVPSWSPYGPTPRGAGPYSAYGSLGGPSALLRLMDEARRRLVRFARTESFDLIHAHDWVTFDAAAAASQSSGKPWIAHYHSIEQDRRPEQPDPAIERIERAAGADAAALVAPSRITAGRIAARYGIALERITVAPNTLSRETIPPSELGLFETRRVLFLGRLAEQKGTDLFARIAEVARGRGSPATFEVRGSGEQTPAFWRAGVVQRGGVDWAARGSAFGDVSALVVPSRAEPFGMVVLEGMQHRVPVFYPRHAGCAEVLQSGLQIDPQDSEAVAAELLALLGDRGRWESVVRAQAQEIDRYHERGYEQIVQRLYAEVAASLVSPSAV
jgi:glycosyltransferase involved in cell wall biosynthesis